MHAIPTPDSSFVNLSGYDFEPKYFESDGLRIHYFDEGEELAGNILKYF